MHDDTLDARSQMRAAFASWPDLPASVTTWLQGLDWRTRQSVQMHHGEGLPHAQVAERLAVSAETVRRDLSRARASWAACSFHTL